MIIFRININIKIYHIHILKERLFMAYQIRAEKNIWNNYLDKTRFIYFLS